MIGRACMGAGGAAGIQAGIDAAGITEICSLADRIVHGRPFIASLEGNVYCCNICAAHLAIQGDLLSKSFHSRSGKAFLFNAVSNCIEGRIEERVMTTGFHLVCDLHCNTCNNLLGWKYEEAEEESQKYKVGKSILEAAKLKSSFVSAPPRDWSSFSASLLHIESPDDK